jgi:hypothetical protein
MAWMVIQRSNRTVTIAQRISSAMRIIMYAHVRCAFRPSADFLSAALPSGGVSSGARPSYAAAPRGVRGGGGGGGGVLLSMGRVVLSNPVHTVMNHYRYSAVTNG